MSARLLERWATSLPHGHSLPDGKFEIRHARLRRVLWAHVVLLPVVSVVLGGHGLLHDAAHALPMAAAAVIGGRGGSKRVQSTSVALGLLTASAVLVHVAGGATEAHFHFFVVMSALALYEDWVPYGLGVAYVFVHHALLGAVAPTHVFGHDGNVLGMALVHAGFLTAAGAANIALWRSNERARERTASALRQVQAQYDVSEALAHAVDLDDAVPQLLGVIGRRLQFGTGLFWTPEGGFLRLARTWTADEAIEPLLRVLRTRAALAPGTGVAGLAWERGTPVVADLGEERPVPDIGDVVAAMRQRGAVAVPILSGREVLGVLSFTRECELALDPGTTEVLESMTRQLAQFMERVRRTHEAVSYRDAALTDALTGLPNRRAWDLCVSEQPGIADRRGQPLCLALLDLDHFKAYNDAHGHQAGDGLLTAAAASWRAAIRGDDVLARYGGEEFALAMPGCDLDAGEEIVERLRQRLPNGQSCSIGLAAWQPGETGEQALARADRALYAAKAAGRDRIVIASAPAPPRPAAPAAMRESRFVRAAAPAAP